MLTVCLLCAYCELTGTCKARGRATFQTMSLNGLLLIKIANVPKVIRRHAGAVRGAHTEFGPRRYSIAIAGYSFLAVTMLRQASVSQTLGQVESPIPALIVHSSCIAFITHLSVIPPRFIAHPVSWELPSPSSSDHNPGGGSDPGSHARNF